MEKGNPNKIMHDSNSVMMQPICVRSYANIYLNFFPFLFFFLTMEERQEVNCNIFIYYPKGTNKMKRHAYYTFI